MSTQRKSIAVLRALAPHMAGHRRWLLAGSLGTLGVVACRLALPWPLRGVLELGFENERPTWLPAGGTPEFWLAGAFVAIAILQGLAELVQRVSFARFAIGLVHTLRTAAMRRLGGADPGDVIARIVGDSQRVKAGAKGILVRTTQNGAFVTGVAIVLLVIDLRLGAAFAGGGIAIGAVTAVGGVRSSRLARRLRRNEGVLAGNVHRLVTGGDSAGDLDDLDQQTGRAEAKTAKLEGFTLWIVHGLLAATGGSVLLLGLHGTREGWLAAGELVTVLFYILLAHNPAVRLCRQGVRIGRVLASAERLVAAAERVPETAGALSEAPPPAGGFDAGFHPDHRPLFESRHWAIVLHRRQTYLGRCLVYLRTRPLEDPLLLSPAERAELWEEVLPRLAAALARAFAPDRLNYSELGNRVSQVHWHVVPRYESPPEREFAGHRFVDLRPGRSYGLSRRLRRAAARGVMPDVVDAIAARLGLELEAGDGDSHPAAVAQPAPGEGPRLLRAE